MKILITLLLLCSGFTYGQQYNLQLNLEKGHTYHLNINSSHHFSGELNGDKISVKTAMTGTIQFNVVNVTATGYELEAGYDSLQLTIHGPMGKMQFSYPDSENDSSMQSPLGMMAHKHLHITLLKNGAVSKIDNTDTTGFSAMMKKFPMAQMLKNMIAHGTFKKHFSKEAMKENIEKMTAVFPDHKVAVNDTWSSVIKPDSATHDMVKINYQLIGYSNGISTIKRNTEIIGRDLSGKTESTMQINASTGWVKEASINSDLHGSSHSKKDSTDNKPTTIKIEGNTSVKGW